MAENKFRLVLAAVTENLQQVISFIEESIQNTDHSPKTVIQITIAVEEIFVNIAHYAYPEKNGEVVIEAVVSDDPPAIAITFIDSGIPYDPLAKADPDITLSANKRQIGGLGIYLVKKTMDDVSYKYEDGHNILTIKKLLS